MLWMWSFFLLFFLYKHNLNFLFSGTAVFLHHQTQNSEKFKLTPPLGLCVLLLIEDSKIDSGVVDDVTVPDNPPWSQTEPQVCLSLTKF